VRTEKGGKKNRKQAGTGRNNGKGDRPPKDEKTEFEIGGTSCKEKKKKKKEPLKRKKSQLRGK